MDCVKNRRKTSCVKVGRACIGSGYPISVQSMTNTDPHDFISTYNQIKALESAGCDIVRITVPDSESVKVLYRLKMSDISVPIVSDIHFDYRMAIEAAEAGADKIRINPGNIGADDRLKAVVDKCREKNIPIRVGINSGSLEKEILAEYGAPTPEALAQSALQNVSLIEKWDYNNIVISVKSSNIVSMVEANKLISVKCAYPLHLGVTEAGGGEKGLCKAACGLSALLLDGIGDTVRVSLTDDPVKEVEAAKLILTSLGIYEKGYIDIISCPTCGRTKIDLINITRKLEAEIKGFKPERKLTVAVMGCVVNGPGEAREADVGIAGGDGRAVLFKKGVPVRTVDEKDIIPELVSEIKRTINNN